MNLVNLALKYIMGISQLETNLDKWFVTSLPFIRGDISENNLEAVCPPTYTECPQTADLISIVTYSWKNSLEYRDESQIVALDTSKAFHQV